MGIDDISRRTFIEGVDAGRRGEGSRRFGARHRPDAPWGIDRVDADIVHTNGET